MKHIIGLIVTVIIIVINAILVDYLLPDKLYNWLLLPIFILIGMETNYIMKYLYGEKWYKNN